MQAIPCEKFPKTKWKLFYKSVYNSRAVQTGSKQDKKRRGSTTVQEGKYIRVSTFRNRRFTGPELAPLLNSRCKHQVKIGTLPHGITSMGICVCVVHCDGLVFHFQGVFLTPANCSWNRLQMDCNPEQD